MVNETASKGVCFSLGSSGAVYKVNLHKASTQNGFFSLFLNESFFSLIACSKMPNKSMVGHQSAMILDKTCTVSLYDPSASVTETPGAGNMATSSSESSWAS